MRGSALARVLLLAALLCGCAAGPQPAAPPPLAPLAVQLADGILARWPDPNQIAGQGWEYNTGIVLYALTQVHARTGDERYLAYVQRWVDGLMDAEGRIAVPDEQNLDRIQPGMLLLYLYEQTGLERYRRGAEQMLARLAAHPRTAKGGLWHKERYPHEMWLDGVYMMGPFCAHAARLLGADEQCPELAAREALLLAEHAQGADGLLRHAWDADANAAWADPTTGLAPVVWGRGMGWYSMALVDMLAALPRDHPARPRLLAILQAAARGIEASQDTTTGLWFQVMDDPDLPGNWIETSASAMFVYALELGARHGYLDAHYRDVAQRGWQGLVATLRREPDGRWTVTGAVQGMGVRPDAASYLEPKRLENSTHGLMAVLLAATAIEFQP